MRNRSYLQGYPLLNIINTMLLRIIEAGLIDFWTRSLSDENRAEAAVIYIANGIFKFNNNIRLF